MHAAGFIISIGGEMSVWYESFGGCRLRARDAREGKASAVFRSFGPLQHGLGGRHWPMLL